MLKKSPRSTFCGLLIALGVLVFGAGTADAGPYDDPLLLAWYPFSGNADDATGNGYHGSLIGDPELACDRFGVPDRAYDFDGNDFIQTSLSVPSGANTYAAWIATTATNGYILGPTAGNYYTFHLGVDGRGRVFYSDYKTNVGGTIVLTGPVVNDGLWHHVLAVQNQTTRTLKLYVDGALVSQYVETGRFRAWATGNQFGLGRVHNWNTNGYFNGLIDEGAMWDRELSATEVAQLADGAGNPVGCVATPPPACENTDESGCCTDEFDDPLDAQWTLSDMGDAVGGSAQVLGGAVEVSGTGSELYHGDDHGAFLHQTATGDFRVEVDITAVPQDQGGQYRKGGLMVRNDLAPSAPRVMVQYVPHFPTPDRPALQFDVRDENGVAYELASTVPDVQLPVRVAIQRRGDVFTVYYSNDDGTSWIRPLGGAGGEVSLAMDEDVLAGMAVASYDPSQAVTLRFDDFSVCRPNGEAPMPTELPCDPEAGLDVVYLLDHSDSMARSHGDPLDGISKFESAQAALREIHAGLALREAPTRTALVTFQGGHHPSFNLASGAVVQSGFTTDFAAMDSLLGSLSLPVLDPYEPYTTTPMAIALDAVHDLLTAERDPAHGVVVIWPTDSMPNIDALGRGPNEYQESEMAAIGLTDTFGDFIPPGLVAWLGNANGSIGTFDGQALADAMWEVMDLRDDQGDLRFLSLVPRGTVANPPMLPEGLLDFAAFYSQGAVFGADDLNGLVAQAPALLTELGCGTAPPTGGGGGGDDVPVLEGCEDDNFDDNTLDAAWSLASMGDADQVSVSETGGALQLTGDGTTAYADGDHGALLYRRINGDFRAELDVIGFPVDTGGAYRKAGLMVRAGLDPYDARIMVQYVPDFAGNGPALQFRARTVDGGPGDVALGSNIFGIGLPVRLAIEKVGDSYSVEYSTDAGTTWQRPAGGTGGSIDVDLGAIQWVGANVVSYDASIPLTAELDNVSICAVD